MARELGYEKLKVYQKALGFVAIRSEVLKGLPRRVAACGHLERAAESILVNIARASSSWSARERIVYLGDANGSALELNIAEGTGRFSGNDQAKFFGIAYQAAAQSVALVELAGTGSASETCRVEEGLEQLRLVAAMLASLANVAGLAPSPSPLNTHT